IEPSAIARSYSAMARSHWPLSYQALPRLRHESADSVSDCARADTTPAFIETIASNEKHWATNTIRLVRVWPTCRGFIVFPSALRSRHATRMHRIFLFASCLRRLKTPSHYAQTSVKSHHNQKIFLAGHPN